MTAGEPAATVEAKIWLEGFARDAESGPTLDHLTNVVNDQIVEALPQFLDPTLRDDLKASTRAHWKGFLAVVTRETIEVQPPPQIYDLARTLARRGFELPLLLSTYRIGRRAVWRFITETLQADVPDPAVRSAVLLQFWTHLADWLDTTVESLIVMFSAEREQWQRGMSARQNSMAHAILAGHAVDVDAASATLAYPLRQHHIGFALCVDESVPEADVQRSLESAARAVSTHLGGGRPLIIASSARAAWCWTARSTPPPTCTVASADLPALVCVSVGGCHPGLDGFRLTHTQAQAALAVARPTATVTRFEDVEIACLAAGILGEQARSAFVRKELGGLTETDETTQRLRETLRTFLATGCDAAATGEQLGLHPNTVRYRVRQAEKRINHPVQDRRVQIELALAISAVLGAGT